MNPNPNFTPLQLLRKTSDENDSDYHPDSGLRQPPNLQMNKSKSEKNENFKTSSNMSITQTNVFFCF